MTDNPKHILLLAGSGEARALAAGLARRTGLRTTASLHYPQRTHGDLAIPTRFGGFGGDAGLTDYLRAHGITAVLDATHPFAARISHSAARVCAALDLPFAQVLRPAWTPGTGDNWIEVGDETAVAALLRPGQQVFTTTGRATLKQLVHNCPARFLVRQMDAGSPLDDFNNVRYVIGSGPFSVEQEVQTLQDLAIDVLVVKNSGGAPSRTKLDAARILGLPVILVARPAKPTARTFETVDAALAWVDTL